MGSGKVYAQYYEIDQPVNVDAGLVYFKFRFLRRT